MYLRESISCLSACTRACVVADFRLLRCSRLSSSKYSSSSSCITEYSRCAAEIRRCKSSTCTTMHHRIMDVSKSTTNTSNNHNYLIILPLSSSRPQQTASENSQKSSQQWPQRLSTEQQAQLHAHKSARTLVDTTADKKKLNSTHSSFKCTSNCMLARVGISNISSTDSNSTE